MSPKLDKDEKEILSSFEADEWESIASEKIKSKYEKMASDTFKKDRRINIRISSKDLNSLQTLALREGLPYQTLISSVLHKYVSGTLK